MLIVGLFYHGSYMSETTTGIYKSTSRKKRVPNSRSTRKGKRKKNMRSIPVWLRNLLAIFIILAFFSGFYYFFIRPYAYRWKPCSGQKEYGVCIPCCYDVHGIDISHYQGSIDWDKLRLNDTTNFPIQFIFMKATEGEALADDAFEQNFALARQYGLIRGAYHFFSPKADALKQAEFFIRKVELCPGDLPPVLDVELKGGKSKKELQESLKIWLKRIEMHYKVKPILYTSYKFKMKYLDDPVFDLYPYWIAHYYVDSVKYKGHWDFWQHTDVGVVQGIKEEVDLNVFNGTVERLKNMTLH